MQALVFSAQVESSDSASISNNLAQARATSNDAPASARQRDRSTGLLAGAAAMQRIDRVDCPKRNQRRSTTSIVVVACVRDRANCTRERIDRLREAPTSATPCLPNRQLFKSQSRRRRNKKQKTNQTRNCHDNVIDSSKTTIRQCGI